MIIRSLKHSLLAPRSHALKPLFVSSRHNSLPSTNAALRLLHHDFHLASSSTSADAQIDNLQDLYATAKDELEIASEETEKKSVYAADDREAAVQTFQDFKLAYERAVEEGESGGGTGEEVRGRIGQRVREMERAIAVLQERGRED